MGLSQVRIEDVGTGKIIRRGFDLVGDRKFDIRSDKNRMGKTSTSQQRLKKRVIRM